MTAQSLIIELYDKLGSPSDLEIYDQTTIPPTYTHALAGSQRLLSWLNLALQQICTWRFPDGRIIRFENLKGDLNFQAVTVTGLITSATATTAVLDASAGTTDDQYKDWLIYISTGTGSGQTAFITKYVGATKTATIVFPQKLTGWATLPVAGSGYTLLKNFYRIMPVTNTIGPTWVAGDNISVATNEVLSPTKIYDFKQQRELYINVAKDFFFTFMTYVGDPAQFRYAERTLYFDRSINDNRWFKLYYVQNPPALSLATDVPNIAANWHPALIMWAAWWGKGRDRDFTGAQALMHDLTTFMQTTRKEAELYTEDQEQYVIVGGY